MQKEKTKEIYYNISIILQLNSILTHRTALLFSNKELKKLASFSLFLCPFCYINNKDS
ncbi:hypothetical protein HanPSC8_Chr08g0333691 [Helianthus annuus]|nr:hypothetical protein HanPSC8_Chr08g0333691 [Helianthus annuus]